MKSFNLGLFASGDYTLKQKAVSKISSAKFVIMLKQKSVEVFGDHNFKNYIVIESDGVSDISKLKAFLTK